MLNKGTGQARRYFCTKLQKNKYLSRVKIRGDSDRKISKTILKNKKKTNKKVTD